MTDRERFEAFIAGPPFEKSTRRIPMDDTSWPGAYMDIAVDLAWQAWCAALESRQTPSDGL